MDIDIRMPIGILFSLLGLLLVGYGVFSDPSIYERSLTINMNLWWGAGLLFFGAVMVLLSLRATRRKRR